MSTDKLAILSANAAELLNADRMNRHLRQGLITELLTAARETSSPASAFRTVFGDDLCTADYAYFCTALLEQQDSPALVQELLPDFTAIGAKYPEGHTAYLSNVYSDRAFDLFSRSTPRLSAYHHPSFTAACEEVYYDRSQYCILPLYNSEDGALTSFIRLMTKYELKIHRVCDISSPDNDTTVRFALLRRGIVPKIPTDGFLEIRLVLPEGMRIGTFFAACEATGTQIARIRTVPTSYNNDVTSLFVTFRISPANGAPLLLFLRSVLYSYSVEGIYSAV